MTFHPGKRQPGRGKYLRSFDVPQGAHLMGHSGSQSQLMGTYTFGASPKGSALLSEALIP